MDLHIKEVHRKEGKWWAVDLHEQLMELEKAIAHKASKTFIRRLFK